MIGMPFGCTGGVVNRIASNSIDTPRYDATGLVHSHATTQTIFTLGQFSRIWGQPLQRDNVAGLVGLPVVVYATDNGIVREYTGALADLQLLSKREITIQVGTPIAAIPQFSWTGP